MITDADRTPRCTTTQPIKITTHQSSDSIDGNSRSSIDDNSSRSSSKTSFNDIPGKPAKPRRPTNYSERTSSIPKRPPESVKKLNLNQAAFASSKNSVPSPPVSARSPSKPTISPLTVPPREDPCERIETHKSSRADSAITAVLEGPELQYFPLPLPTRPEHDVPKAPANRMYWHQPTTHGMLAGAPTRRSHSVTQIGPTVYIFGGSDGKAPKATNTVFIFDTDTSLWRIPKASGNLPPPLRAHTTIAYRYKIYLFGGGTGNDEYYNHVYVFSAQTYRWSCLIPSNRSDASLPTPRRAHTAVLFDSGMYVFGGGSGTSGLNDLWRLDLTAKPRWTQLHPTGRKPEPRVYHTATVVRDVMIIYGGLDGKRCFSNIFLYNFKANTYNEVIIPNGPRLCRISHTTTCVGSQLFVFGGSDGMEFNNQLWIFDLMSRTWCKKSCAGTPPAARGYHTAVFNDARLWVFGGMDTLWEGFSDVHVLEFGGSGYLGSVYVDHIR